MVTGQFTGPAPHFHWCIGAIYQTLWRSNVLHAGTLEHTPADTPTRAWRTWTAGSTCMSQVRWVVLLKFLKSVILVCPYTFNTNVTRLTWFIEWPPVSHNPPLSDPADPSKVFETPQGNPSLKEGEDFLFKCLLTDPLVTNLTLQSEDGRNLPTAMNVTFDPQRGALIRDLKTLFNGRYVCSGWKDGRQFRSRPVNLLVFPGNTCLSLYLFIYTPVCLYTYLITSLTSPVCVQCCTTPPPCLLVRMNLSVW